MDTTNPTVPDLHVRPDVVVEVVVRVGNHRLCFRAERSRIAGEHSSHEVTNAAVRSALVEASEQAGAFMGRAYPDTVA